MAHEDYVKRKQAEDRQRYNLICECIEQAYGDKIGKYTMKGNELER